jgi:hypothetical protein
MRLTTERRRQDSSRTRILDRLTKGPATNTQLSKIALRFGARIFELRKAGHNITSSPREGGVVIYTLA